MPYKKSPASFTKHKSNAVGFMAEGSAAYLHGDPGTPHIDPNNETLVSSKTTKTRETTPEGIKGTRLTTKSNFRTPGGEVKKTPEGDKAYAALSQEQKDAQDDKFRQASQTRFTPDALKLPKARVEITTPEITAEVPTIPKKEKVMPTFDFSIEGKSGKTLINKKFRPIDLPKLNSGSKTRGKNPCKSCN